MKPIPAMAKTLHGCMRKSKKLVFHKNRAYSAYSRDNDTDLFNKF